MSKVIVGLSVLPSCSAFLTVPNLDLVPANRTFRRAERAPIAPLSGQGARG